MTLPLKITPLTPGGVKLTRCGLCNHIRVHGALSVCIGCGGTDAGAVARGHQASFLYRLITADGGTVTHREMVEWVWGDREDGGPLRANGILRIVAGEIRAALRRGRSTLWVYAHHGVGWRLGRGTA